MRNLLHVSHYSGKTIVIYTEQEAEWAQQTVWMFWKSDKYLVPAGNGTTIPQKPSLSHSTSAPHSYQHSVPQASSDTNICESGLDQASCMQYAPDCGQWNACRTGLACSGLLLMRGGAYASEHSSTWAYHCIAFDSSASLRKFCYLRSRRRYATVRHLAGSIGSATAATTATVRGT